MYLSERTKFRIGIGLVTLPAFMFGLLIGVLLILLLSAAPTYANEEGRSGKSSSVTTKITLILHETKTKRELRASNDLNSGEVPIIVVVKDGMKIVKPV